MHTPGPWRWRDDDIIPGRPWTLYPGVLIADGRNGTPGGDEIDRANAALIASAPNMLVALQYADAFLADQKAGREKGYDVLAHKVVRAAIAKAEGREAGQ